MSDVKHFTIVTTRGFEKIQSKYQNNETVNLTHMGFGGTNEYTAPNVSAIAVPNQWAKIPLERHPDTGFIGGGATITNQDEYKGQWIANVGIYDEDDELIIISATPLIEMSLDSSVVASYPIDIFTVLDNTVNVIVVTDTSITHPTHDELNAAINGVKENTLFVVERLFPVGHVHITVNAANPATYGYPGLWEMQGADMTLLTTRTASDVNQVHGTNTPSVPLLQHSHSAQFSGDRLPAHSHSQDNRTALVSPNSGNSDPTSGSPSGSRGGTTSGESGGTPTGRVSVSNAGVKNATLDVRGKHLTVYVFLRTE